jgi:hypothetical protein
MNKKANTKVNNCKETKNKEKQRNRENRRAYQAAGARPNMQCLLERLARVA